MSGGMILDGPAPGRLMLGTEGERGLRYEGAPILTRA
jgi:hypothetical protein